MSGALPIPVSEIIAILTTMFPEDTTGQMLSSIRIIQTADMAYLEEEVKRWQTAQPTA